MATAPKTKPELPESTLAELREIEGTLDTLSPEEKKLFEEYKSFLGNNYHVPEKTLWEHAKGAAGTALDYGLRGLDYAGGVTRTGVAEAVGAAKPGDMGKALKGQAPGTSEYMANLGIPPGASLSDAFPELYSDSGEGLPLEKGGALDPTARGAGGFVGDILLDPLTYASMGTTAAAKTGQEAALAAARKTVPALSRTEALKRGLNRLLRPTDNALEALGRKSYKAPFKALDAESAMFGKTPFSDVAAAELGAGSKRTRAKRAVKRSDELDAARQALYKEGDELGAAVDLIPAVEDADKAARQMGKIPSREDSAEAIQELIDRHRRSLNPPTEAEKQVAQMGGAPLPEPRKLPLGEASEWKTGLYDTQPDSAFSKSVKTTRGRKVVQKLSGGIDEAMVAEANRVKPKMGDAVKDINDTWGTLLTGAERLDREALTESQKRIVTAMDLITGNAFLSGAGPYNAGTYLALKKLLDASKFTAPQTYFGTALKKLSRSGKFNPLGIDPILRQELLMGTGQRANPWTLMQAEDERKR